MPDAARLGDQMNHGGTIGPTVTGTTVMIGYLPAATMGDPHVCPASDGPKPHVGGTIIKGSATVLICNKPAARVNDPAECKGPPNKVAMGCATVQIGDSGGGGGGGGAGGGGGRGSDGGSGDGGGSDAATDSGQPTDAEIASASAAAAGPPTQQVGTGTHWIEIELVDEAEQPVVGEPYEIKLPNGKEVTGGLDGRGQVRVTGIDQPGSCQIKFPNLDQDTWHRWGAASPQPPAGSVAPPQAGPDEGPVPQGPDMPGLGVWHRVREGECVSSLARDKGLFWATVWNHAQNAEIKRRRGNPNVLLPDDWVFIPTPRPKSESGSTDQHHKFLRQGELAKLRLRILDGYEPRANLPYRLTIDRRTFEGTTDADGRIQCSIPGNARSGRLHIGNDVDDYILELGAVDPVTEVSGIQARLNNLGFDCGPVDGRWGPKTETALSAFQIAEGLDPTGELDQVSCTRLLERHGS